MKVGTKKAVLGEFTDSHLLWIPLHSFFQQVLLGVCNVLSEESSGPFPKKNADSFKLADSFELITETSPLNPSCGSFRTSLLQFQNM